MDSFPFYTEDLIDFEADKQQDLYEINYECNEELDYPEYDDFSSNY